MAQYVTNVIRWLSRYRGADINQHGESERSWKCEEPKLTIDEYNGIRDTLGEYGAFVV